MSVIEPHPNTSRRLLRLWNKHHSFSEIARRLPLLPNGKRVNPGHVYKMIVYGIEPSEKAPEVRHAMGLPKTRRKPRPAIQRPPLPPHLKWWHSLTKDQRAEHIRQLHALHAPLLSESP